MIRAAVALLSRGPTLPAVSRTPLTRLLTATTTVSALVMPAKCIENRALHRVPAPGHATC
jgi:hypothetical protein